MRRADAEHSREGARRGGSAKPAGVKSRQVDFGQADGGTFPIGTLARLAGVSTRTIRYYEEIGLLSTARRFSGGRRVFDGDALQRLGFIGRLKRLGFSLAEIRHLNEVFAVHRSTAAMLEALEARLAEHVRAVEARVADLNQLRSDLLRYRDRVSERRRQVTGERR